VLLRGKRCPIVWRRAMDMTLSRRGTSRCRWGDVARLSAKKPSSASRGGIRGLERRSAVTSFSPGWEHGCRASWYEQTRRDHCARWARHRSGAGHGGIRDAGSDTLGTSRAQWAGGVEGCRIWKSWTRNGIVPFGTVGRRKPAGAHGVAQPASAGKEQHDGHWKSAACC